MPRGPLDSVEVVGGAQSAPTCRRLIARCASAPHAARRSPPCSSPSTGHRPRRPGEPQLIGTMSRRRARSCSATRGGGPGAARSFALTARDGDAASPETRCDARSLDRPLRFFLAKEPQGRCWWSPSASTPSATAWRPRLRAPVPPQLHADGAGAPPDDAAARRCPIRSRPHARFFAPPMATLAAPTSTSSRALRRGAAGGGARVAERLPQGSRSACSSPAGRRQHRRAARRAPPCWRSPSAATLNAFTLAVDGGGSDLAQARAGSSGSASASCSKCWRSERRGRRCGRWR